MRISLCIVVSLAGCGGAGGSHPTQLANKQPPPAACIPSDFKQWKLTEMGVAAEGDRAVVCLRDRAAGGSEGACLLIDPATGNVLGKGRSLPWHGEDTTEDPDPPAVTVPFATPDNTASVIAIDAKRTRAFVLGTGGPSGYGFVGDTYELASGKRIARVDMSILGGDGPPPPVNSRHIRVTAPGAVLLGREVGYGAIVDPIRGTSRLVEPSWAVLARFVAGHDFITGDAYVLDLADLRVVARKHFGDPPYEGATVPGEVIAVGGRALVVGYTPPQTLLVDETGAISAPRPIPFCPP
jgi:hypothetical protein